MFATVCRGNRSAEDFLALICDIAHTWDDLIDKDVTVDDPTINDVFYSAMVMLPRNEFYRANFDLLHPLVISAIDNWKVANILEATDDAGDKRIAFISRSSYVNVALQVAHLIGGPVWAAEIGPELRRFVHGEGWDAYLASLEAEKAARAQRSQGD
jgi:hypothetical protein